VGRAAECTAELDRTRNRRDRLVGSVLFQGHDGAHRDLGASAHATYSGLARRSRAPTIDDIDAFNAEDIQRNQNLSLREVWDRFLEAHEKLIELLERTPVLTRELVAADTCEHYREHLQDILEYEKRRSPSRRLKKE